METTFCTVTEFAEYTGLSRPTINALRKQGVIPYMGKNPVRIPFEAACAALVAHAERTAAEAAAAAEKGDANA